MGRDRHPRKDIEQVLQEIEARGWRVTRGKKYFMAWCPCGEHKRSVVLTSSNPHFMKNLRHWFARQPCWTKEEDR